MDPKIHNKGEVGEFKELKGIKTLWSSGWREERKSGDTDLGIEPRASELQADSLLSEPPGEPAAQISRGQ